MVFMPHYKMKNLNYIFSFGGWFGLVITLLIAIFFNKCNNNADQIINKKIEIRNYYDSSIKLVPVKYTLQSEPIFIPIPANVDTAKILAMYFAKFPYSRVFQDSNLIATIVDTITQNKFNTTGKFSYKWLAPIKTVESTTLTVESAKRLVLLAGIHLNFNQRKFVDFGPDIYLKTKRDQLIGVGYDIDLKVVSLRGAFNLNQLIKKRK